MISTCLSFQIALSSQEELIEAFKVSQPHIKYLLFSNSV